MRARPWYDWLVLATFGSLILAAAILVLTSSPRPVKDGSAEAGFARDMAVHHAQAVDMATLLRDRTTDERMRSLALDMALTQQGQIGQFEGWLSAWGLPSTGLEPAMAWMGHHHFGPMPGMATPEQLNQLRAASGREAEVLFLRLMIPHHVAGVEMAQGVLERTDRPEVRRLADAIIAGQEAEIQEMQSLLAARGESPAHVRSMMGQGSPATASQPLNGQLLRLGSLSLALIMVVWLSVDTIRTKAA